MAVLRIGLSVNISVMKDYKYLTLPYLTYFSVTQSLITLPNSILTLSS